MKKLLFLILPFISVLSYGQQTDATTKSNTNTLIRNAPLGGVTRAIVSDMADALTDSKVNRSETLITTGTNDYTISPSWTPDYSKNPQFKVKFVNGNTGAVTVNTIPVKKNVSSALSSGDIAAGAIYDIVYDGTNFQIILPSSGGGGGTWGSITGTLSSQTDLQTALNGKLASASNLSDLGSASTARTNLGLGTAAVISSTAGGDLSGTLPSPTVAKINGNTVPSNASGALTNNGSGVLTWTPVSGSGTVNSGTANQIAYYAGSGTAVSGTNAIPNNTTATTQSPGDNSTKVATTAYANAAVTAAALPAADGTHDGYLTQTDWSTFNTSATGVRPANLGGTGLSTYAVGDLIYASATTPTLSKLADVATGNALISGGVNTAPSWGKITSSHIDATVQTAGLSWLLASGGTLSGANTIIGSATNLLTFSFPTLNTTITDGAGAYYKNPTAAAAGLQQISPIITIEGNGWKTNATAGTQPVAWQLYNLPVQGAAAPTTNLVFQSRINGADGVGKMTLKSDGAILSSESTGLTVRANSLAAGGVSFTGTAPGSNELFVSNTGFSLRNSATISTPIAGMTFNMGSFTTTSGSSRFLEFLASYAPTSGTGTFAYFTMPSTSVINETGGANGDVSIFNLTPVITSAGGNFSLLDYNPAITTITGSHYGLRIRPTASLSGFATGSPTSTLHTAGSFATGYVAKTGTYTATGSDYTIDCTSGTFTVTLPTAVGITGRLYVISNSGAGTITIGTTSSQTFANVTATPTTLTMATVGARTVQSNGANWILISSL